MEAMAGPALRPVQEMIEQLNVNAVFGAATQQEDEIIVPVADVMYGFGFGYGSDAEEGGGGAGGGGGGKATPRGFIHISPDGVHYESTDNDTLIALVGMFTAMWAIFWTALTVITLTKAVARVRAGEEEASV